MANRRHTKVCKTEVLTVILRCLTGLNLDCIKSYDKTQKMQTSVFVHDHEKREMEIFVLCVIYISFVKDVKDEHTYGKKMARKFCQRSFIKGHSFRNSLYVYLNVQFHCLTIQNRMLA